MPTHFLRVESELTVLKSFIVHLEDLTTVCELQLFQSYQKYNASGKGEVQIG